MIQVIHNPSKKIMFVGGKMIPPGESRPVDVIETAQAIVFDPSLYLTKPVTELPAAMVECTLDELNLLLDAETQGKNRKTAISAINTAIDDLHTNADLAEFALELSNVEDLNELRLKVADDEAKVLMVEHEIATRGAGNE